MSCSIDDIRVAPPVPCGWPFRVNRFEQAKRAGVQPGDVERGRIHQHEYRHVRLPGRYAAGATMDDLTISGEIRVAYHDAALFGCSLIRGRAELY